MTFLSKYKTTGIHWTRFRNTGPHKSTQEKLGMEKFKVFIDDGIVGHVLAENIQEGRRLAIIYFQKSLPINRLSSKNTSLT